MKNALIFAMPPLPRTMGGNLPEARDFVFGKQTIPGCISQAEPLVRYVLGNIEGETELILLCRPETEREVVNFATAEEPMDLLSPISSLGYLLRRLVKHECIDTLDKCTIHQENDDLARFTLGKAKKITFLLIRNSDERQIESILLAELKRLGDIDLYIGLMKDSRRFSLLMKDVLKLLGKEAKGVYGVDGRNKCLVDESGLFSLSKYADGIHDFIKFSKTQGLKESLGKENDSFIKALDRMDRGLSYCNISLYRKGLEQLRKLMKQKNPSSPVMNRKDFPMLRSIIEEEYGRLLKDDRFRYIDVIKNCNGKGMIMQALSFLEAKFTDDLFYGGVLYYEPDEEVTIRKYDRKRKKLEPEQGDARDYISYIISISQRSYATDQIMFVLQNHCNVYNYRGKEDVKAKVDNLHENLPLFEQLLKMTCNPKVNLDDVMKQAGKIKCLGKEEFMTVSYGNKGKVRTKAVSSVVYRYKMHQDGEHISIDDGITLFTALPEKGNGRKYRILASAVLCLYYVLKDARNALARGNHDEIPDEDKLSALIRFFCQSADALLSFSARQYRDVWK